MNRNYLTKTSITIMLGLLGVILIGFYLLPGYWVRFRSPIVSSFLFALAVSLLVCNVRRISSIGRQEWRNSLVLSKWGSVVFHLGLIVIIVGFGLSLLFGMRASVMIPEKVGIKFPTDLTSVKKGIFHVFEEYIVGLNDVNLVKEGNLVGQVRSEVDFFSGSFPNRRIVEINKPATYMDYYWRSMNWGYSAKIEITQQPKVLLNEFVNIATHGDGNYFDQYTLPGLGDIQLRFYPQLRDSKPVQGAVIAEGPAVSITLLSSGDKGKGEVLIPQGGKTQLNGYTVAFSEYRLWEEFDVSNDPGEALIYIGGILSVVGLFFRIILRRG